MTSCLDELNRAWDQLSKVPPIALQYRTKVISVSTVLELRAGVRANDNSPCLILQTSPPPDALFELSGMRLHSVPDDSGPLLVLSLEDPSRRDLFSTICADVVDTASQAHEDSALAQFLARLGAWRQFLRNKRVSLSRSEAVGLIGELLVCERLTETDSNFIGTWKAPFDGLHDFESSGHALEVKTSLGPASVVTISKLDQLETTGVRRLDLLHVRLIESSSGRSMGDIINSLGQLLPEETGRRGFENLLLQRGLLPGDDIARSVPRVRLRTIDAYGVTDGFPRLVRSNLPTAITEATYTLEVRSISAFAVDTATTFDLFHRGDF